MEPHADQSDFITRLAQTNIILYTQRIRDEASQRNSDVQRCFPLPGAFPMPRKDSPRSVGSADAREGGRGRPNDSDEQREI